MPAEKNKWESAAEYERKRPVSSLTLDPKVKNAALRFCKKAGISLSRFAEECMQSRLSKAGQLPLRRRK
jgi:hypothetical protein